MLLGGAITVSNAQSTKINVVTSAVPFLRISPDIRGAGMGDVGIATTADANSGYANIAKIPFLVPVRRDLVHHIPLVKRFGNK